MKADYTTETAASSGEYDGDNRQMKADYTVKLVALLARTMEITAK